MAVVAVKVCTCILVSIYGNLQFVIDVAKAFEATQARFSRVDKRILRDIDLGGRWYDKSASRVGWR